MIKYLGSKRRLVDVLTRLAVDAGASSAVDPFCGTTRVAQAFKVQGLHVSAGDTARYAALFADCYVATDADAVDLVALDDALADLDRRPGVDGYATETWCRKSRFFQPHNGERIDAIRRAIATDYAAHPHRDVLLTALIEAADRVDSTTGVQMAYLKQWSPRSHNRLQLRRPGLLSGPGAAARADAADTVRAAADLAYLDPPYNQHRYTANYHVWETLAAEDEPEVYGTACKRDELQAAGATSPFNRRRDLDPALAGVLAATAAPIIVLSYNDEGWLTLDRLVELCGVRPAVTVLGFPSRRYVGAQIGIHNPSGEAVGQVGRLHNVEYVAVAGDRDDVAAATAAFEDQQVLTSHI